MQKRRIFVIALSIPLLFFLLFGGVVIYYFLANPTTAQVSIQPSVKNMHNIAALAVVIDHPDAAQHQIVGARLLSMTATQTMTLAATGKGNVPKATAASGIMEMIAYVPTYGSASISAGGTITGDDGITVVVDQSATAYTSQRVYFRVHVATPGSHGNIPAYSFHYLDNPTGSYRAEFYNVTPFTGGQDAGPYTFVQQHDITVGEQKLTSTVEQGILATLPTKMVSNEQWVSSPICTSKAIANTAPGQRVQNFQVKATATCSGEVYDTQVVQMAATQEFTATAQSELGESYQLLGKIVTIITGVQVTNEQQGALSVSLLSKGTWIYHFTIAQKQYLVQLIRGKSIEIAQKLLLQQEHVEHVTIKTMYGFWIWNTVPTDMNKISIVTPQGS